MAPKAKFYKQLLAETGGTAKKALRARHFPGEPEGFDVKALPSVSAEEFKDPLAGVDETMLDQLVSALKSKFAPAPAPAPVAPIAPAKPYGADDEFDEEAG